MRIEINAEGISGAITVLQFQAAVSKHLEKSNDVISAFVTVQRKTSRIDGQTPRLQEAQAALAERVQIEENRALRIFFRIRWRQMRGFQIVFHRMQRSFIR